MAILKNKISMKKITLQYFSFDSQIDYTRVMAAYGGLSSWTGTLWGNFQGDTFYFEAKSQYAIRLFYSEGDIEH